MLDPSEDGDRGAFAHSICRQQFVQGMHAGGGFLVAPNNNVAAAQPSLCGGTAGLQLRDQHTRFDGETVVPHQRTEQGNRLACHTDKAAADTSVFDQPAGDPVSQIARD